MYHHTGPVPVIVYEFGMYRGRVGQHLLYSIPTYWVKIDKKRLEKGRKIKSHQQGKYSWRYPTNSILGHTHYGDEIYLNKRLAFGCFH